MWSIAYDTATGFVYAQGNALEDPMEPGWTYIADWTGETFPPPIWYVGPSAWYWVSDGNIHWYQEGEPEPIKPFDIDDAKIAIDALILDAADCESDRSDIHDTMDTVGSSVTTAQSNITTLQSSMSTAQANITSLQAAVTAIQNSRMAREYISGFCWFYDSSDSSRILLDTGFARNDANDADISLISQVYVDLDNSGAGGIDTGSKAANSTYFLWVISKADGTTNGMFSLSASSPTMPSGYINKRLVGFIFTLTGSAAVQPFNVKGFGIDVEVSQLENQVSGSTTATNASLGATRISPSFTRMPYVFGVITSTLSLLGQRAYILTKTGGAQVTGTPAGVIASVFANTIPLDSSRNAWYGSTALGLGASLTLQGGTFSRRV